MESYDKTLHGEEFERGLGGI
ncbi:uncharacterized protein G2W53_037124 [Senna tora]|uniref:Uncharacterized protein n=1 Tax=Senna tora TaxID=362788 RepID=A0A834W9C3_9FABA|nr:uncharacterized protein G2W53_037124 [Senna tora]